MCLLTELGQILIQGLYVVDGHLDRWRHLDAALKALLLESVNDVIFLVEFLLLLLDEFQGVDLLDVNV